MTWHRAKLPLANPHSLCFCHGLCHLPIAGPVLAMQNAVATLISHVERDRSWSFTDSMVPITGPGRERLELIHVFGVTGSTNINQRMSMRGLWWSQNIKYINYCLFYQHPPIPIDILIATATSHSVIHVSSLRRHRAGSCRALGAEFGQCHGSRSCSKKRHWEWCASASRAHCHRICGSQSSPRREATTHSFLCL